VFAVRAVYSVDSDKQTSNSQDEETYGSAGIVHFNNPNLLRELEKSLGDSYLYDRTQETADPKRIGGIRLKDEAHRLAYKFRMLSNEEIAVTDMQLIYDSLRYEEVQPDLDTDLRELTDKVYSKFDRYLRALSTLKMQAENLYGFHLQHTINHRHDCCDVPKEHLRWDDLYMMYISQQSSCDLVPPSVTQTTFNPGRNLTEVFQHNFLLIPSIKWQYFISLDGIHNEYPAHNFHNQPYIACKTMHNTRHRDVLVSSLHPQPKKIVLLIDHGNSLSPTQLSTAKAVAKQILLSLSPYDKVGVIRVSSGVTFARDDNCVNRKLVALTTEVRYLFNSFIELMEKDNDATDHSLGFTRAFDLIRNTLEHEQHELAEPGEAMIMYISRGLLSSLTDARDVLDTIAVENGKLGNRVVINTYAVIDDGKPIIWEKSFLENIAEQNFRNYLVESRHANPVVRGVMTTVNTTKDIGSTVGSFFKNVNKITPNVPKISLPYKDPLGSGLIMSITWPCFYDHELFGLVGFDVPMGEVVEAITYYTKDKSGYAFMIDKNGYTVMHPSLGRPIVADKQPMYTDISHFESEPGFDRIRSLMLLHTEGVESIDVPMAVDNSSFPYGDIDHHTRIRYAWKKVEIGLMNDTPFIVVTKTIEDRLKSRDIREANVPKHSSKFVYHRLDLLPTDHTCMHLKQLANTETSALFLSASSFVRPYEHLSQQETKRMVQGYLAYFHDNTELLKHPVIRDELKKDVAALSRINDEWIRIFKSSKLNDYIIRRYVATPDGAFSVFPGTLLNKAYDPSKREWYTRALEYPGKVTLTAPHLDQGGAGYIVTISHTIYEGRHAALHGPNDRVVAVMGMDVTLGYFYKLLVEQMPLCEESSIRCFIMDDRGYLIAHKGLIEPNGRGPVEQQHITHKEPVVANDILNHDGFVQKKICNSYNDRTIQRFYSFQTNLKEVITNLVHGEHCSRYQMTGIPGTNTFLGIVNQTCDVMTAFCPCSMVDRLCLNCHRMEQTECECPCECPLEMDFCSGQLMDVEDRNPTCEEFPEDVPRAFVPQSVSDALPQCFQTHCSHRKSKIDCMGVLDCEWCVLDSDGTTPLKQAFCSTQRICFAGVLGAGTPYHDEIKAAAQEDKPVDFKSTPVGPVAGGIMGCFLVLALGVYCYRHHVHRNSHQYISSLPDTNLRMSNLDNELEEPEPLEEGGAGHTNIVLATFENPASISPYRVNTTYRRPATTGESDHGYSTMTPHEDSSEQASTTCIEPLIVGRDRYRPSPHTVLKTTPMIPPPPSSRRSRSPTPPQTRLLTHPAIPEQTVLPEPHTVLGTTIPESSPHSVIANVQVHMVDTH